MLINGIECNIAPKANLRGANLQSANLQGANLQGADLQSASLWGASLWGANLQGATELAPLAAAQLTIAGQGELRGFKKLANGVICELRIPADAKRSNATGRKCRAARAIVISGEGVSRHDQTFIYTPGLVVTPREPFDDDRWNECGSGIHFFITREEAEAY